MFAPVDAAFSQKIFPVSSHAILELTHLWHVDGSLVLLADVALLRCM